MAILTVVLSFARSLSVMPPWHMRSLINELKGKYLDKLGSYLPAWAVLMFTLEYQSLLVESKSPEGSAALLVVNADHHFKVHQSSHSPQRASFITV